MSVQRVILAHLELERYLLQLIGGFSVYIESRSSMSNNQNAVAVVLTQW